MGRFMLNNLPFDASEGDIKNMLIGLGIAADNVLSIIIPKGHNGIGRGFAVVELYDTANAIGLVPGFEYEDRFITVSSYDPSARTGLCEPSYYRDEISEDRDMFCRDRERPRRDRSSYKWNQPEERREPRQRRRGFRDDYVYGDLSDYYASFGYGSRDEFVEADYQESDDPSDRNYGGRLRQHYYPYSFTVNDRKSIARQRGVLSDDGKEAKCESCRETHKLGLMDLHHRPPLAKRIIRGERSEDSRRSFFDPERILVLCKSCHKQLHKDKPRYYYPDSWK